MRACKQNVKKKNKPGGADSKKTIGSQFPSLVLGKTDALQLRLLPVSGDFTYVFCQTKVGLLDLHHLYRAFLNGLQEFSHKEPVWTHPKAVRLRSRDRAWQRDRGGQSFRHTATFRPCLPPSPERRSVHQPVVMCGHAASGHWAADSSSAHPGDALTRLQENMAVARLFIPSSQPPTSHTHTCAFSQTHRCS